ncbi:dTDP-4-dehydrorhamnose reductase [Parasphingopyxis marina]|uniref:dTDP-4-dehydrorhamnose reductase n=1 Tax=Parasphingopyxis marina TaxID=2761622 RepID=A0A842HY29_9SPHN|nr:dTDP-4-dehydrorhamnose reductase [Parasphingopyxis marina]MBC2778006.1 dTDP-4-dehydrorhamnose reductase [Parasphingopyxis marina]
MKILLLGAAGQIGHALTATMPEGCDLLALDRNALDITDTAALTALIASEQAQAAINAAAYTDVDAAEAHEEEAFGINAEAPRAIAAACARSGTRLVHISTDYVFDGTATTPYRPDARPAPLGVYGRSKLAGEQAVQEYPDALLIRSAWVYDAHGRNFLDTMLRLMTERNEIRVVADQTGTPTHAKSLARAIWALLDAEARGIHHFTDAGKTSWHGFAKAIEAKARELGLLDGCTVTPTTAADYGAPAPRPAFSVLDCRGTWPITGTPQDWNDELDGVLAERKAAA